MAQAAGTGLAGSLFSTAFVGVLVFAYALGPVVLVVAALPAMAVLYFVAAVTPGGSPLTASPGGRVLWTVAVLALGLVNWAAGAMTISDLGLSVQGSVFWWASLSAVPFALAAGACAGGWTSIVSAVLTVALLGAGCS